MMDIEILEKFNSKRNQVYKVKIHTSTSTTVAVMKKYVGDKNGLLVEESNNLHMLHKAGLCVPHIIHRDKDSLFLEYIQGCLINDLVESLDMGHWIEELSLWLSQLHQISTESGNLLKMDVNLRNFIYSKDKIYGLDFEGMKYGDARTDLANICFFILTNYPSFKKEKNIMVRRFLQSYEKYSGAELKDICKFLLQSKAEAKMRRHPFHKFNEINSNSEEQI